MRQKQSIFSLFLLSPSSRRAWIEIMLAWLTHILPWVTLLAEGVDRNIDRRYAHCTSFASPSSRRAWIEMPTEIWFARMTSVALLAEGVDRNQYGQ